MMKTNTFNIPFDHLNIDSSNVIRYCGYGDKSPKAQVLDLLQECLQEVRQICQPRFGYCEVEGSTQGKYLLTLQGQQFHPGAIITRSLSGCKLYLIVISTAGVEFDHWLHSISQSGDMLKTYLADAIGSLIAEYSSNYAIEYLENEYQKQGLLLTNSYSPGYCDWFVAEQKQLFRLLPEAFCSVTLNDSALMNPIKSTSCVVGIDENAVKRPYGCQICGKKDCFLRIARIKHSAGAYQ